MATKLMRERRPREAELESWFADAERELGENHLDHAARGFAKIIAANPHHGRALHRLGTLAIVLGRSNDAVELIRRAIIVDSETAAYHCDLGVALHRMGKVDDAAAEYRQAVRCDPEFVHALANLGGVLVNQGKPEEALVYLEKALAVDPNHGMTHTNLGVVLHALGRGDAGLEHARLAVELAPRSPDAARNCASLLFHLNRTEEALVYCERHISLEPHNPVAHEGYADCFMKLRRLHEAAAHYWKALQFDPSSVNAANNLGICLAEGGYQADALSLYRRALELQPDNPAAWVNVGEALRNLGEIESALTCQERALELDPKKKQAHWDRSLCLLSLGRLPEAWDEYEWRWEALTTQIRRPFSQPTWDGGSPAGAKILVWMEQGLGDQILFSSMLPDLLREGAHCVIECDYRLVTLFARSFPGVETVPMLNPPHPRTSQPDIGFQIPGGSLARRFRPNLDSFPRRHGFLTPDPDRAAQWRQRVAALGAGLKVGICWRSMTNQEARRKHYSSLAQWGPILTLAGIQFVNLQYDNCQKELLEAEQLFGTKAALWDDLDLKDDQEGVAALISALDLVISAGTAVDQMAGALGVPTWVLARSRSDLWGLGTHHCPWYPGTRLFGSSPMEPWEPAIERLATELRNLIGAPK